MTGREHLDSAEDDVWQRAPWNELASPAGRRWASPLLLLLLLRRADSLHHPLGKGQRLRHHGRQRLCDLPCA